MPYPKEPIYYIWICRRGAKPHRCLLIYDVKFGFPINKVDIVISSDEEKYPAYYLENADYPDMWNYYFTDDIKFRDILISPELDYFNPNIQIYSFINEKLILRNPADSSWRRS